MKTQGRAKFGARRGGWVEVVVLVGVLAIAVAVAGALVWHEVRSSFSGSGVTAAKVVHRAR